MTSPANRDLFLKMLNALGKKDYDTFERCLADDLLCEWPYVVMEGFPSELRGSRRLREALEVSFESFAPYAYRIVELHSLEDPDRLIAEYTSHSHYLPRDLPYSNRYVGIFDFHDGQITRWREYVNPLVVLETLGDGQEWREDRGAQRRKGTHSD